MAEKHNIFITQDKNCLVVHFPSHVEHINRIEQETRNFLDKNGLTADAFPVCLVMREALINAVEHGNRSDLEKTVKYSLRLCDDILTMEIEDQGDGFDWRSIQNIHPSEQAEHGRGIFIMRRYFSGFRYNEKGNRLTLTKYSPTDGLRSRKPTSRLEALTQAILQSPEQIGTTSADQLLELIEDLYVRNNRLALQNAELRRAQAWDSGRSRSEKTTNGAVQRQLSLQHNPVDTITVDQEGRITEYSLAKKGAGGRLPDIGAVMYKDYAAGHKIDMHAELMGCIKAGAPKEFSGMEYEDKVYHIRISPFPGGAIITSLDVASLKKAEKKFFILLEALEATGEEVVVFDHTGIVEYANTAFLNCLGVALNTIVERKYDDDLMGIVGETFSNKMRSVLTSGEPWAGRLMRSKDGTRVEAGVSIKPVTDDDGTVMGYISVSKPSADN